MEGANPKAVEYGWRLRDARVRARKSQFALHVATGISEEQISRIERGVCYPQDITRDILEEALPALRQGRPPVSPALPRAQAA